MSCLPWSMARSFFAQASTSNETARKTKASDATTMAMNSLAKIRKSPSDSHHAARHVW